MLTIAPKKELKSKWIDLTDGERILMDYLTNEQDMELTYLGLRCINISNKKIDESFDLKYKQLVLKYAIKDWELKDKNIKCELITTRKWNRIRTRPMDRLNKRYKTSQCTL